VIVYHLFGWPWLTILLPAMGVMFALAGSLMAASLDKRGAGTVVTSRLRRLLPPLWAFGLIAVPLMIAGGWLQEDGDHPFSWSKVAFWLVPIGDPGGSERGIDLWEPLWYLRAYLWFVVLSPLLYPIYRRIGWAAVAAPIVLLAVLDKTGFALPDVADTAMWDFVAYGACWIAGFAHHDGRLARTKPWAVLGAALVMGGAALYWLRGHPGEDGFDLNDVPESQALWSLAFVLVVMRWQPTTDWLERVRPVKATVTLLNARAVTIYLWHNVMIAVAWPLLGYLALDDLGPLNAPVTLTTVLVLTAAVTMMFGWVEDLAAQRRPRLWPATSASPSTRRVPAADASETPTAAGSVAAPGSVSADSGRWVDPAGTAPGARGPDGAGHRESDRELPTGPQEPGSREPVVSATGSVGATSPAASANDADDPDPTPIVPIRVPVGLDAWGRPEGYGPRAQEPADSYGPAVHGPAVHGPAVHGPAVHGPAESYAVPESRRAAAAAGDRSTSATGGDPALRAPADPWADAGR
jgi:peptidoglycan/LPS O-acetylase OafA/YrhL